VGGATTSSAGQAESVSFAGTIGVHVAGSC
jgi:hypothetical protein